jgi:predicted SAM-dependent methyltransferase
MPLLWRLLGSAVTASYRKRWAAQPSTPKVLNLGGGSHIVAGALTVDIDPRADSYVDITQPLPFANASVDYIFCEEVIEHIDKRQCLALLKECQRILRPGGAIRITTPDLDWLSSGTLAGTVPCDLVNSTFYGHGHRYLYSRRALLETLADAGFTDAAHSTYRDSASLLGFMDTHADRFRHAPELSQYVEAQCP